MQVGDIEVEEEVVRTRMFTLLDRAKRWPNEKQERWFFAYAVAVDEGVSEQKAMDTADKVIQRELDKDGRDSG